MLWVILIVSRFIPERCCCIPPPPPPPKVPRLSASDAHDNGSSYLLSENEGSSHTTHTTSDDSSTDVQTEKRRMRIARAVHEFNLHVKEDDRAEVIPLTSSYHSCNSFPPSCFHTTLTTLDVIFKPLMISN